MAFIMVLHEKHEPQVLLSSCFDTGWIAAVTSASAVDCCVGSRWAARRASAGWLGATNQPTSVAPPCCAPRRLQDKMVHWLLFVNMALVALMLFVDLAVR